MNANDRLFLIMGLVIAAFGVSVFLDPTYESWRYGHVNFGEHHEVIGLLILALGVAAAFAAVRKR